MGSKVRARVGHDYSYLDGSDLGHFYRHFRPEGRNSIFLLKTVLTITYNI